MKKLLVLLLALLPIMAFSKKKPEDKLLPMFKKAMKQEKQPNGYYMVTDISGKGLAGHSGEDIDKGNAITVSGLFQWAEFNMFVIMDYTIETWGDTRPKIGDDKSDYVKTAYFLHTNDPVLVQKRLKSIKGGEEIKQEGLSGTREIKEAYDKFKLAGAPDFNQLKNKGSFILVGPDRRTGTSIIKIDDVLWSGNVVNGFIDGTGVGIFKVSNGNHIPFILSLSSKSYDGNVDHVYIYISGSFKHGMVSTKSTFRGYGSNYSNEVRSTEIGKPDVYDLTVYWENKTNDKTVLDHIDAFRKDCIEEDFPRVEAAYNQALKNANNKTTRIEADPCIDRFLNCYDGIDTKGKMPMVKEVSAFYSLCNAMTFSPSSSYYEEDHNIFGGFNGEYSWLGNRVKRERTIMKKAFEILANNSKYGFDSFYNYCRPKLEEKNKAIETKIANEWSWYKEWEQERARTKRRSASSSSSSSSSSSYSSSSSSDGNSVSVPDIKEVQPGLHGRMLDSDTDYTDDDTYVFKDGVSIKVFHRYREGGGHTSFLSLGSSLDYYYPSNLSDKKYKTAEDAARAGWVWKKKELIRTIGTIE